MLMLIRICDSACPHPPILQVYLHKTLLMVSWKAGIVLLCGQLADAVATPAVGILSDRSKGWQLTRSFYLGRRHLFYLIGTALVIINFFFLFGHCVMCEITHSDDMDNWLQVVYLCFAASVFNVGWASVQVAHLSMVPELTSSTPERVKLNSVRYSATVLSNLLVFGLLAVFDKATPYGKAGRYHLLAYVVLGIGTACSFVFLLGTEESKPVESRYQQKQGAAGQEQVANGKHSNGANDEKTKRRKATLNGPSDQLVVGSAVNASGGGGAYVGSVVTSPVPPEMLYEDDYEVDGEDQPPQQEEGFDEVLVRSTSRGSLVPSSRAGSPAFPSSSSRSEFESTLAMHLSSLPVKFMSYKCWLRQREFWWAGAVYMCTRLVVNVSQVFLPFLALDALDLPDIYITILPCVLYVCSMISASFMQRLSLRFGRKEIYCVGFLQTTVGLIAMFFLPSARPWCWIVYPCCVLVGLGTGVIMVSCTQLTSDLIGSRTNYSAFVFGSFSFTDKLSNGIVLFALQSFNNDSARYARWAIAAPPVASALLAIGILLTQIDLNEWRRKHTLSPEAMARMRKDAHNQQQEREQQEPRRRRSSVAPVETTAAEAL